MAKEAGEKAVKKIKAAEKISVKKYSGNCDATLMAKRPEKAVAMLASYCERFEISHKDLCDFDKKSDAEIEELEVLMGKVAEAQRMVDVAMAPLSRTRNTHRTLATSFDEAEVVLHEGLHQMHEKADALSCGRDRMDDARSSLLERRDTKWRGNQAFGNLLEQA